MGQILVGDPYVISNILCVAIGQRIAALNVSRTVPSMSFRCSMHRGRGRRCAYSHVTGSSLRAQRAVGAHTECAGGL